MFFSTLAQDLRIGLRVLIKERGFCALAATVLALGICGVTTMFSVVNGVMLRGFSYPNADRLISAGFIDPTQGNNNNGNNGAGFVYTADFEEFRAGVKSTEWIAAYLNGSTVNLTVAGNPQRQTGAYVTPDFFRVLGVKPALGRDFTAADNLPGAEKVALISQQIWQRDFGGDPTAVGRSIRLNGTPATIIGVMPAGFNFPVNEQLWIPLYGEYPVKPRSDADAAGNTVSVLAALRPGVALDQAAAEFNALAKNFSRAYPASHKNLTAARVQPLLQAFLGNQTKPLLFTMLGFCVVVLLIACVNVMNMQFARATLRSKELAIRSSLGATRARLVRQMLTESLLVALLGAVVGVALSFWTVGFIDAALRHQTNPPPSYMTFDIDGPVLAFTLAATLLAALVSGLVPAWMSSRAGAGEVLKESGRGNTSRTVNFVTRALVVLQLVLSCVLLIGSILQVRSITKQYAIDYGYDTSDLMSARMGLMDGDYPTGAARRLFYDRLVQQLRAHPEIEAAALTSRQQMVFDGNTPVEIEGKTYQSDRDRPNANFELVSDGYFAVTRQKLTEGRDFDAGDLDAKLPVAVINAAFAQKHFGNESPLGRRLRVSLNNGLQLGPWRTIVGVVSTVRMQGPFNNPEVDDAGFYVPFYAGLFQAEVAKEAVVPQFGTVVVRPRGGQRGEAALAALRAEVKRADPNLPLYFVNTPKANQDGFIGQNKIVAQLFAAFGSVALLLASVGLYGIMSFSVNQRTQEFGIRMALGADANRILGLVLRQGLWQVGLGLSLGLGSAFLLGTLGADGIQNFLFGVSPVDPATYASVGLLLATVSLLATFVPARRATRVSPLTALRSE
ncbi:MAG: ABC transporter permease [Opitutae bacterium]|nr:ABC transporter permease [Opitutae bacterium]